MAKINLPSGRKNTQYIKFEGGYDTSTPPQLLPPGSLMTSINVEQDVTLGGYSVIDGYERYDGHPSPRTAHYAVLNFTTSGTVFRGDTIIGATSGATAIVAEILTGKFIIYNITGIFVTETTTVGAASVVGPEYLETDVNIAEYYRHLAYEDKRNTIQAVPGENEVRGVVYYKGVVYAFRDALTPATGIIMYKATASGWSSMAGLMGRRLGFSNANSSVEVGDVITQGGTTANILKVVVHTGTLASGVNAGTIFIDVPVGPGFAAGAATTTGAGALTLSVVGAGGAGSLQTIPNKGGKYDFAISNFGGSAGSEKVYASNPNNATFEWDGTYLVNMNLGLGGGVLPEFNVYHKDRLFLTYRGSLIYSAIGNPYLWVNDGGGEIAVGDNITALMSQPGADTTAALAVYCRNRTYVLYGTSVSDWNLVTFAEESGAIPYSAQKIGTTYVVDDVGITTLQNAQEFGNFASASISNQITSWLDGYRTSLRCSIVCRTKQQYRLYFSGAILHVTLAKNGISFFPVRIPSGHDFYCAWSSETYGGGDELMFAGSDDGFVYQLDAGDTLDGADIAWGMQFPFVDSGSHRVLKRYRNLTVDVTADQVSAFRIGYTMDAGYVYSTEQPDNDIQFSDVYSQYDMDYGTANTPYRKSIPLNVKLSGVGDSISIFIGSSSVYAGYGKMNFTGAFLETSTLRQKR